MSASEVAIRKNSPLFAELSDALLRGGHSVQFRVNGESMSTTLEDGDTAAIAPASFPDLRPGDIALIQNPDGLLLHRVCDMSALPVTQG